MNPWFDIIIYCDLYIDCGGARTLINQVNSISSILNSGSTSNAKKGSPDISMSLISPS